MSIDIDDHLQRLLDRDPESAEAVNIRIARNIHADLELVRHPWGQVVARTAGVWSYDDLRLDLDLFNDVVFASVWVSEYQYRIYADVGIRVAAVNTNGFGWVPIPGWEAQLVWSEGMVKAVGRELEKHPAINW